MDNTQDPKPRPTNDPVAGPAAAAPTPASPPDGPADAVPPEDATRPVEEAPSAPADAPPTTPRIFRLRSVIAVAAAGVVLGAAGGVTVTALVDGDHNRPDRSFHHGERGEDRPGLPPGGQMPGTTPEDGSEEDAPAIPSDTSTS